LAQFEPDIVHAHSTFAGVTARLIGPLLGARVVYCPHGWAMDREQRGVASRFVAAIEKRLSSLSDAIVAISLHERQTGLNIGIKPDKLVMIANGLRPSPPPFPPESWEDPRLKVLFVGRLDRQKGVDILLEAVRPLQKEVTLRIVGDVIVGGQPDACATLSNVSCCGWLKPAAVASQMSACDVVVVPSRWEGFGYVALEAMRLGKPVLASRVGGLKDIVVQGETGYLFEPGNSRALSSLLVRKGSLSAMGQRGRAVFLERFTAERMAQSYFDLYRRICARRTKS
jgi:glycosyltransferase involved in cell wall biosynthesis